MAITRDLTFPLSQYWLIDPVLTLLTNLSEEDKKEVAKGMCGGGTDMLIAACLVGDFDIFMLRMQCIKNIPIKEFPETIEKIKLKSNELLKAMHKVVRLETQTQSTAEESSRIGDKLDKLLNSILKDEEIFDVTTHEKLSPEKIKILLYAILEIHAFIDGLLLTQGPSNHPEIFPPNYKGALDIEDTMPIMMSKKLENQSGITILPVFSPVYENAKSFSCSLYESKQNLFINSLASLRKAFNPISQKIQELKYDIKRSEDMLLIEENETIRNELKTKQLELKQRRFPFALRCNSSNHAIPIIFDAEANKFMLGDLNYFPPKISSDEELVRALTNGFSKNGFATFNISVLVTQSYADEYQNYIKEWQEGENWEKLHTRLNLALIETSKRAVDSYGASWMIIASRYGHHEIVKMLLANGADVNQVTKDTGGSALYGALSHGHTDIAELLIKAGANVNQAIIDTGMTPLLVASDDGYLELAKLLIEKGADINHASKKTGLSSLHRALLKGHLELAKLLIEKGASINQATSNAGMTPLLIASRDGYLEIANLLIDKGANINQGTTDKGVAPLFIASQNGHLEIVKLLIEKGANINQAINSTGESPLYTALMEGHLEIAKLLIEKGADVNQLTSAGVSPLHVASQHGYLEIAKLLIDKGADVNQGRKKDAITPLWFAAQEGHFEIVKLLVENNANVNQISTDTGASSLFLASQNGHTEIVKLLTGKGADVNQGRTDTGLSPLFMASQNAHFEIVKSLIENNANVNVTKGPSPLYIASQMGHIEIVKLLLGNKEIACDPAITASYSVLLKIAAQRGHEKEVKELLEKNSPTSSATMFSQPKNSLSGFTPLFAAVFFGHKGIVKELLEKGADKNQKADGISVMDFAKAMNDKDMMEVLNHYMVMKKVM